MIRGIVTLLNWSLRLDARRVWSHLLRGGFLGFILVSLFFAWIASMARSAPGLAFFSSLAWLNLLLITVAGVSRFAAAVTEEKKQKRWVCCEWRTSRH